MEKIRYDEISIDQLDENAYLDYPNETQLILYLDL